MLLMIDNYDSFTYNLVQYFKHLGQEVVVCKSDKITLNDIHDASPEYIVISPGPGSPNDAGISLEVVTTFYRTMPILGICLGHQCIAQAFGANIIHAPRIMHGKVSSISHNGEGLFRNIPSPYEATRYHSLAIELSSLSKAFLVTATCDDTTSQEHTVLATSVYDKISTIMAIQHRNFPLYGVQFHPESIATQFGYRLLENFLNERPR